MEYTEGRREFEKLLLAKFVGTASRALDFDEEEWRKIFSACGSFSMRLQLFGSDPRLAIRSQSIADAVYDEHPGPQGAALANKIAGLPELVQLAVMDIVDRFWIEEHGGSMSEILDELGVRRTESAHAKLDAAAISAELDLLS